MHVLIIILVAIFLIYLILKSANTKNKIEPSPASTIDNLPDTQNQHQFAYISRGKLFTKQNDQPFQELQSAFIQSTMDKIERSRQRNSWKEGTSFDRSFVSQNSNLPSDQHELKFTSAQFTDDNKMLYFIRDSQVGGLFEYCFNNSDEKRLIHKQRLLLEDLVYSFSQNCLIGSQQNSNGTADIITMQSDGAEYREVTGGDTLDTSPSWIPEDINNIIFQSSGIARNEHGYVVALGPASLQMLDLNKSELKPILENDKFDFMQPKVTPNGDLCFIRRPYELPRYRGSSMILDTLFFPFRLIRAVFHYLNFFSLMYSQKPLTSASGPEVQADLKELMIKGKRINAENALRKENRVYGVQSLVPKSWQLIKRNKNGQEHVLASNVAAYDITSDGSIIFTNGFGIFSINQSNQVNIILKDKLVTEIIAS